MKKIISLALALITALSLISLMSCSNADVDLRKSENTYADVAEIIKNHNSYVGKSVAFKGKFVAVYNFSTNKIARYSMLVTSADGSARAIYEVRHAESRYPRCGSDVTVYGTVNKDNYIDVDKWSAIKFTKSFTVDALDYTPNELTQFIKNYRKEYADSEYYGETIRIFGHLKTVEDGYTFLVGLDGNGKYIWDIELRDEKNKFDYPSVEGDTVNPVEIVGELSTYTEKNVVYACINVLQVGKAESVFSEDIPIK